MVHQNRTRSSLTFLFSAVRYMFVGVLALAFVGNFKPQTSFAASNYPCAAMLAPDQVSATAELQRAYSSWKTAYLTTNGAGGYLRVQRPENGNDSVSEGIAYGMVLAAYLNDRPTFDGLWSYARSHLDGNGLMHWRIDAANNTVGWNAATDADEDMALALIVADRTWGGYGSDALALINRIMQFEVEANSYVLKPGDAWGGSQVTNPSYFAPGYYKVFQTYSGDARWKQVADRAYEVIANVNAQSGAGTTGLQPDWTTAAGTPASGMGYNYTYDATRVPWRLAMDAAWFCDQRATAQLAKINTFFEGIGAANIKDGYQLNGAQVGQWHNASFVAPAAAGALLSTNASYRTAMWNETVALTNGNYYNDSLRVLGLLLVSGAMPAPGGSAPTQPTSTAAPSPSATPPATATSAPSGSASVKAQYLANNTNTSDNQIGPHLQLVNVGGASVPLSELTLRYWFTRDGNQSISYWCDWAAVGCANISARFGLVNAASSGADTYLELSFSANAGTLAAGANSGAIQSRVTKSDWSNYNESNDYSFNGQQTAFADWSKVTVYRNGTLIWGQEPSVSGSAPSATATSAPSATATSIPTATSAPSATATSAPSATATSAPSATASPTAATASMTLKALYRAGNTSANDNQIGPHLQLVNVGGASVPLSEITVRYWFTRDGTQPTNYWCDWAALSCANVTAKVMTLSTPRSGADAYLELGFATNAGSLAAGASTGEIQSRLAKNDWSNYNESNDYSFNGQQITFADWSKVTVYRNGTLIWGQEP